MPRSVDPGLPADADDGDDFEVLQTIPNHLKRKSNQNNPIEVSSSSDEDSDVEDDGVASTNGGSGPSKRRRIAAGKSQDVPVANVKLDPDATTSPEGQPETISADPPPLIAGQIPSSVEPEFLLSTLLDILPDLDREYALTALADELEKGSADRAVASVLEQALELPGGYPVSKAKEIRKESDKLVEEDYLSKSFRREFRVGDIYHGRCVMALEEFFSRIPTAYIKETLQSSSFLYAIAYRTLSQHSKATPKPYQELKNDRNRNKGKGKTMPSRTRQIPSASQSTASTVDDQFVPVLDDGGEAEFEKEKLFVDNLVLKETADENQEKAKRLAHDEALANEGGITCGCCFGEEIWEEMFQCAEGHLFCRDCATTYVETKLGEQQLTIECMDGSGCNAAFPETELRRLLNQKSLNLYYRLQQVEAIEKAGIEDLETCPSCPYAAVLDNPEEKLFRCMNDTCGQVTCRKCRRAEHLPKSCEEMDKDRKLDKRHTVEEAMSEALVRRCPNSKCQKPFVKESGCNKIMCQSCHTLSCYVCRKAIPEGYAHFDRSVPHMPQGSTQSNKCPLYASDEAAQETARIIAARDDAKRQVKEIADAEGVVLGDEDLNVAAPDISSHPKMPLVPGPVPPAHWQNGRYIVPPMPFPRMMFNHNYPRPVPHVPQLPPGYPAYPPLAGNQIVGNHPIPPVDANLNIQNFRPGIGFGPYGGYMDQPGNVQRR